MKTIKERAIKKYCTHCGARLEYNCPADGMPCPNVRNYIEIAKEQKAIDDDHFREVTQKVINKAVKWVDENVGTLTAIALRKVMEKEV